MCLVCLKLKVMSLIYVVWRYVYDDAHMPQ